MAQRDNKRERQINGNVQLRCYQMHNDSKITDSFDPYDFWDMDPIDFDDDDTQSMMNFASYRFQSGHPLRLKGVCVMKKSPPPLATLFQFDGLVAKPSVAQVIEELVGDEIQRFPILFEGRTGEWEMINLTRAVRCLDLEKSEVRYFPNVPDSVMAIRRTVLNRGKMGSCQIFRLAEHIATVVVSGTFREKLIERVPVRGTQFSEVETV